MLRGTFHWSYAAPFAPLTTANAHGTGDRDLTAPSYGIHGTPSPEKIGKTESHGCIRLTNWDALDLAGMVHRGTIVAFVR